MSSTFRSTSSTRRSSFHSKPVLTDYNAPSQYEKLPESPNSESNVKSNNNNNYEMLKFNENTYSFAKILNQLVEKVCDDIEERLGRLESRMTKLESLYEAGFEGESFMCKGKNNRNKNHCVSEIQDLLENSEKRKTFQSQYFSRKEKENIKNNGNIKTNDELMLTGRLETLEEGLSALKSEFILRQSQLKKLLDSNKHQIMEDLSQKLQNLKKETEPSGVKELKKGLEKLKNAFEEQEIRKETQTMHLRRIEDDMVQMLSGIKDLNEIRTLSRLNRMEIQGIKTSLQEQKNPDKRGRSHREKNQ